MLRRRFSVGLVGLMSGARAAPGVAQTVAPAAMPACSSASPPGTVALVELFTSEGCSSCPPADRWLSRLAQREPAGIAPLSLHVKYCARRASIMANGPDVDALA
jgi:hypothetical protein